MVSEQNVKFSLVKRYIYPFHQNSSTNLILVKNLAKNNTIGTILVSVFITLLLVGVGGYFGLPILYPNLNADLDDEGNILQTKYNESQTYSHISWYDYDYEKMSDMELNITTSGNSKLRVTFECPVILHLNNIYEGATKYNITLDVSGVENRTNSIYY